MNTALPCRKGVDDAKRSFFFFCFTNHDSSTKGAVFCCYSKSLHEKAKKKRSGILLEN